MRAFLGIDVGTSAVKVIALAESGEIVAAASEPLTLMQPAEGFSEQDPNEWWKQTGVAARAVVARCRARGLSIAAVGLSGQMHGLVALDRDRIGTPGDGGAVRPCILWNDQRSVVECDELERLAGGAGPLVEATGNAAFPGFTLPKLLWMRRHEPERYARIGMVLLPKDFVRWRLTGDFATDVGDACGTSLFDPAQRVWNEALVAAAGIQRGWLPTAFESGAPTGVVLPDVAAAWGLDAGTIVAAGSGDNMAGAVGAGVVSVGDCLIALGSSGVVLSPTAECRSDTGVAGHIGRTHTMCHADGDAKRRGSWCITGCTLSAGFALQWAHDSLWPESEYALLFAEANSSPAGCDGLVFLPQLMGERCPFRDPLARGAWIGLSARHTRGHLVRAILEGVTFTLCEILRIQRELGANPTTVRVGGGGARSPLWRQILADVTGLPVVTTNSEDGPALGAAMLGGVAAEVWPSVGAAAAEIIVETGRTEPAAKTGVENVYAAAQERLAAAQASLARLWRS